MRARLSWFLRSAGMRHGIIMAGATFVAGALDYAFNIITGRLLSPTEYGVFIAVTAILQVMVYLTNSIRNVVAYYMAELATTKGSASRTGRFLRRSWRWAWRWGLLAAVVLAVISPWIARLLRIEDVAPLWAASAALLLLFLRPVTDGALQGLQQFARLGTIQVLQAVLRLVLAIFLLRAGLQAFGGILALPLASAGALVLALWFLRHVLRQGEPEHPRDRVNWSYSLVTLLGLLVFALTVNMDAIVVKRVFDPVVAGNYGPVVTLGKMNLFLPLALGMVLFPKVTQRQATGRDARPILLLALAATLFPGLLLTAAYAVAPGTIVTLVFGATYADPGAVLPLVGLATTLFAGLNIWLNYALSADRPTFVYALAATTMLQATGMVFFHDSLLQIAIVMVVGGLLGNVAGLLTTVARPGAVGYTPSFEDRAGTRQLPEDWQDR